jgi:hypothetical protein
MEENIRNGITAADWLLALGHAPFVPHLTHFWNLMSPQTWETWLRLDEAWLLVCDCLVRLPGESNGADREVLFCQEHEIPVYIGMEALMYALEPGVEG